ncbi:MAG: GGDEF domain-containing protein [Cyanobacteria bacterium P01_D01_bin.56]
MVSSAMHQTTTRLKGWLPGRYAVYKETYLHSFGWTWLENLIDNLRRRDKQDVQSLQTEIQELRSHCRKLIKENQQLSYEVNHDSLTGLYNRRYFDGYCEQVFQSASLLGNDLSLLVIDIDHFKRYNDTRSHQAGDRLLQRLGQYLLTTVQTSDNCVARYGGEEFVVVLPQHDCSAAYAMARTIRLLIKALDVTVSIGIACYGKDGKTPRELFYHADQRLYVAKQNGRDCIVAFESCSTRTLIGNSDRKSNKKPPQTR